MNKPSFSPEYFYDEVREGFYVPEMMKRFWGAQLVVLYEIVKICERHDIAWYADMGTLLGAVRHKGYIPWDDDLDISMNREDWDRFFEVAKEELPGTYCVLSVKTEAEYDLALGRITNSRGINTSEEHLKRYCGCPYVVGVDVYPIDRIYKDPEKEKDRMRRAKEIRKAMTSIGTDGVQAESTRRILAGIERDNHLVLHRKGDLRRELILLFDQICMECRDEDYEEVAFMGAWLISNWANCPRQIYEERIKAPFENNTFMISKRYDEVLSIYYHDYMTIRKGGGAHDYPAYGEQERILKEHIGHNPYRYTFRPEDFDIKRREKTFREKCAEIIELLQEVIPQIERLESVGDRGNAALLLESGQSVAIRLGTMLEGKYGDDCQVVRVLEEYCELLYAALEWTEDTAEALRDGVDRIRESIASLFGGQKREIVFLPCREAWWDTMKALYEKMGAEPGNTVRVMPIPVIDCDPCGGLGECHNEENAFCELDGYTKTAESDLAKKHPEVIVVQLPFDNYSTAMRIPEEYCSDRLLKACDELWYIPCFSPDAPISADDKAVKTIPLLAEQPAVINADKVILHDEQVRECYIERLTELAGENSREYWERKIEVL